MTCCVVDHARFASIHEYRAPAISALTGGPERHVRVVACGDHHCGKAKGFGRQRGRRHVITSHEQGDLRIVRRNQHRTGNRDVSQPPRRKRGQCRPESMSDNQPRPIAGFRGIDQPTLPGVEVQRSRPRRREHPRRFQIAPPPRDPVAVANRPTRHQNNVEIRRAHDADIAGRAVGCNRALSVRRIEACAFPRTPGPPPCDPRSSGRPRDWPIPCRGIRRSSASARD